MKLVCEICGGSNIVKEEGVFVCKSCGCQYSVEEVKKLVTNSDNNECINVTPEKEKEVKRYIELSVNAYETGSGQSAFDFASKALEINPESSDAWIAKMKSLEFLGKLGELRLMEVVEAGTNAIQFAPTDKKEDITIQVYTYQLQRGLNLFRLVTNKYRDTSEVEANFKKFAMISPFTAAGHVNQLDSVTTNVYELVANQTILFLNTIPDDVLCLSVILVDLMKSCASQYSSITDALDSRYKIYGYSLTDVSKEVRCKTARSLTDKANKAKDAAIAADEKRRKEAKERYWTEHAEEKTAFENELKQLKDEVNLLDQSINQIKEIKESLPSKKSLDEINLLISNARKEYDSLGLFKGKQKKEIQEKIDNLGEECKILDSKYFNDKMALDKQMDPLLTQRREKSSRIAQIERELTKDR